MSDEDCASYGTCVLNINRCVPRCSNRIDDDGDGIIDFPLEPGCAGAGDDDETDPSVSPSCGNGLDDDSDGLVDYPNDPGCAGVGDRDELDPDRLPACGDGRDNDNDGTTDYPEDRGCESAADHSEGGACGRLYEAVEVTPGDVAHRKLCWSTESRSPSKPSLFAPTSMPMNIRRHCIYGVIAWMRIPKLAVRASHRRTALRPINCASKIHCSETIISSWMVRRAKVVVLLLSWKKLS